MLYIYIYMFICWYYTHDKFVLVYGVEHTKFLRICLKFQSLYQNCLRCKGQLVNAVSGGKKSFLLHFLKHIHTPLFCGQMQIFVFRGRPWYKLSSSYNLILDSAGKGKLIRGEAQRTKLRSQCPFQKLA